MNPEIATSVMGRAYAERLTTMSTPDLIAEHDEALLHGPRGGAAEAAAMIRDELRRRGEHSYADKAAADADRLGAR